MRHVLCNYARDRRALKRGGAVQRLPIDEALAQAVPSVSDGESSETLLALDEALTRLEQVDPRRSKVVECRFFGGLSIDETAAAIGISPKTVKRDWIVAQAWLHREMSESA